MGCISYLSDVLKKETKIAAGCTEIAAIGYGIAYLKEMTNEPYDIEIYLDYDTFKNAVFAGVPNGGSGLIYGIKKALLSKPKGLETLLTSNGIYEAEFSIKIVPVNIPCLMIFIKMNDRCVLICGKHDSIAYEGSVIPLRKAKSIAAERCREDGLSSIKKIPYIEIYSSVNEIAKLDFVRERIRDAIMLSKKLSEDTKHSSIAINLPERTLEEKIVKRTAIAIEARMSGSKIPAMSVAGSGNQGIMTTLPLTIYGDEKGISREDVSRAIVLSWLTTIYATAFTKYTSPICGAGIKAGIGLAAGFGYLMGEYDVVEGSIINQIATLMGMVCDGAKAGCSLKVIAAIQSAYRSSLLSARGIVVKEGGIASESVEKALINVGRYVESISNLASDTTVKIIEEKISNKNSKQKH